MVVWVRRVAFMAILDCGGGKSRKRRRGRVRSSTSDKLVSSNLDHTRVADLSHAIK